MIITGDFNENVCSTNMQNFMTETGLFDVFHEINGVEPNQREDTGEHESKCMCYVLATEGILRNMTGIEIIECSETIESDYQGCLIDVDFLEYFAEEFVDCYRRRVKSVNPNRKKH